MLIKTTGMIAEPITIVVRRLRIDSLMKALGRNDFHRLKIGIGRGASLGNGTGEDVVNFVLGTPGAEERSIMSRAEQQAAEAAWRWVNTPIEDCMNIFNRIGKENNLFAQEDTN